MGWSGPEATGLQLRGDASKGLLLTRYTIPSRVPRSKRTQFGAAGPRKCI